MILNNKNLGDILKETRTAKKIAIEKVFEETYIPVKFIKMIEDNQWSEFPSEVHLKGYLRLYSSYLKIDSTLIDKYLKEILQPEKEVDIMHQPESKSLKNKTDVFFSKVAKKKIIALLLILVVVFIIIFLLILHLLPE